MVVLLIILGICIIAFGGKFLAGLLVILVLGIILFMILGKSQPNAEKFCEQLLSNETTYEVMNDIADKICEYAKSKIRFGIDNMYSNSTSGSTDVQITGTGVQRWGGDGYDDWIRYIEYNIQSIQENYKIDGLALAVTKLVEPKLQEFKLSMPQIKTLSVNIYASPSTAVKYWKHIKMFWTLAQNKFIEL